jgi:type VI secretion system secreted protein Hcp
MAVDAYLLFQQYGGGWLTAESQVSFANNTEVLMKQPWPVPTGATSGSVPNDGPAIFEVTDFSFDIEQTLSIGSATSGAGAGKVTFNPFSITRKIDKASPTFFEMACSGTAFQLVTLMFRKSSGAGAAGAGKTSGVVYLRFDFKLVAVKTISWSHNDEGPEETITFEYGGLMVNYAQQEASGKLKTPVSGGWNRVANTQDTTNTFIMGGK